MRAKPSALVSCVAIALAACANSTASRLSLANLMREAPNDMPLRLLLADDTITGVAVPLGPGTLPAAVRTTFDAIAPGGKTTFVGREASERGDGFRLEKYYADQELTCSVLAAVDGSVLERWHSVGLRNVPLDVMAAALTTDPVIEMACIVSGPAREEHWQLLARDRGQRTFVLTIGLRGEKVARRRRMTAQVDS